MNLLIFYWLGSRGTDCAFVAWLAWI